MDYAIAIAVAVAVAVATAAPGAAGMAYNIHGSKLDEVFAKAQLHPSSRCSYRITEVGIYLSWMYGDKWV